MAKVAVLVDFAPRTRVVVDIPENMSLEEWAENDDNFDTLVSKARANMCKDIESYLSGDNMINFYEDDECPYGSLTMDNAE